MRDDAASEDVICQMVETAQSVQAMYPEDPLVVLLGPLINDTSDQDSAARDAGLQAMQKALQMRFGRALDSELYAEVLGALRSKLPTWETQKGLRDFMVGM